jgi:hypothetical protein
MFSRFMARRNSRSMIAGQGEERLDAPLILEEDGSNFVHGLDLLEALLDHRLALVGLEHLGRRPRPIVGDQRIHAVALVIVGNGQLVDRPFDVEAPLGDLAIARVGSWSAPPRLLKGMVFAHGALNLEVASNVVLFENSLDVKIDIGGAPQSRSWSREPLT